METIIKLHSSELDSTLLKKFNLLLAIKNVDVIISLKEMDSNYSDLLTDSINQAEHEVISMTLEKFLEYKPTLE